MKIHIICRTRDNSGILARLAHTLARETEWTLGDGPDMSADLNLWQIYIEYAEMFTDWHFTPVAAWFSHLESDNEFKSMWWDRAASHLDIRLTSAPMYAEMLAEYGPTALVTPPVDREMFRIRSKQARETPVIGVAGYVHPGGRKGENLVHRLATGELSRRIEVVGSGSGWPVPCKTRDFADVPEFFQSLDVYLCSSTVEGIPMPPLEALACGVKLVIPRGVGLLDTLPDVPGIARYEAGDYHDMVRAVAEVLDTEAHPDELRAVTETFTAEAWAQTHRDALCPFIGQHRVTDIESDRHGARGAFYVAYGKQAVQCARASMDSFKTFNPGIEVALVSNEPTGVEDIFIFQPDSDIGARGQKTRIYTLAPDHWQYILYLDADTEIIANIGFLYEVLQDGWDMLICKNPGKYHTARKMVRTDNKDECRQTFEQLGTDEVMQWNGGVFAFQRNPRTQAFFTCWHREWKRWGKRDQAALLRALWMHPLKTYYLGNEWNTILRPDGAGRYTLEKEDSAGILHRPMTARRWRGIITGRSDSQEAWSKVAAFQGGK